MTSVRGRRPKGLSRLVRAAALQASKLPDQYLENGTVPRVLPYEPVYLAHKQYLILRYQPTVSRYLYFYRLMGDIYLKKLAS